MVRQNTMYEIEDPAAIELQRGLRLGLERREVEKRKGSAAHGFRCLS